MSTHGKTKRPAPVPAHVKYRTPTSRSGQELENKLRPSEVLATLTNAGANVHPEVLSEGPKIVDFLDLQNTTTQTNSSVELDKPIFQPYPHILKFPQYEPFGVYEQTLYFRNNDSVSRRIRVMPPDSPFFEVIGPRSPAGMRELEHSKIGPGMEVCFIVKFRPQEVKDYKVDLICVTEREKFLVPVHALGLQAVLNLPDSVDFGVCPVKSRNVKTILTQNVGTAVAKFTLSCTRPMFEALPVEGIVEVGQTIMIELAFTPQHSDRCEGDLVISYEDGDQVFMSLSGVSENVGVFLSTPAVQLDGAYISLSSQKTVKVQNKSEIPVKFSWKQFVNEHEEEAERQRLFAELMTMQQLEGEALERDYEQAQELEYGGGGSGASLAGPAAAQAVLARQSSSAVDDDDDLSGDEAGVPAALREARAALSRKYRHLRRALEEDSMGFADGNFEIKPMTGEIWATSEIEVTITFRPDTAADYACSVYLDVIGRDERLPLWLTGTGIGPKGVLTYDVLDIGDVFVNSLHHYELGIANKGDIPATWRLQKSTTPFGQRFNFSPDHGQLAVGASDTLGIKFCSDILGEFSETFNIQLKGSDERLSCQVKGHVVGPTFAFDVDCIDFGLVSYSFSHTKTVVLTNTSDIDMAYALSIPQDGAFAAKKEFTVSPTSGTLAPGEKHEVTLVLVSTSVKMYDYFLTVDVAGVGKGLLSVPILADCRVPTVEVKAKELACGECFVRYPYDLELMLSNTSPELSARFAVVPQEDATKVVAEFVAEPSDGTIASGESASVRIRLVCVKLGSLRLPLLVTVAGSVLPPLQATLTAEVCGPRLIVEPSDVINWGNTDCLFDTPRALTVINDSDIPAPFRAFIKNARSKFRLDIREGVLAPRETSQLTVTANLDDTIMHRDSLHMIVTEGANLVVPLVAKGTGTTMYCHEDLSVLDFGAKFTAFHFERKVTLENKGRRAQTLKWFNQTAQEAQVAAAAAAKKRAIEEAQARKAGKKAPPPPPAPAAAAAATASTALGAGDGGGAGEGQLKKRKSKKQLEEDRAREADEAASLLIPTFTVHPAEVELRPRTAVTFTFKGYSTRTGLIKEKLVCETRVQGGSNQAKPVFRTTAKATFTNPLLEMATPEGPLEFTYAWREDEGEDEDLRQHRPLTLTNRTSLDVAFALKAHAPFSLSCLEWTLQPGETASAVVTFDPGYKGDRQALTLDSKVLVVYPDHPQRDSVPIFGAINFPNLSFDSTVVNFGSVLNDTTKTMSVRVKNTSKVPAEFWWSFIEDEEAARAAATSKRPYIPINQVYDILPIRSQLQPGEEEDVEFIYYGHPFRKFKGSCVCEVKGGPEYELTLLGEASTVGFRLDRSLLDFGKVNYSKQEDKDFYIVNTTKVAFSYRVTVAADKDANKGCVEVHPSTGTVAVGEKQRVAVRFKPGLPELIRVALKVECAHFEAVYLPVYGEGIFPSVFVSLPRDDTRQLTYTAPLAHPLPPSHGGDDGAAGSSASSDALPPPATASSDQHRGGGAAAAVAAAAAAAENGEGGELNPSDKAAGGEGSNEASPAVGIASPTAAASKHHHHLVTPFGRATTWAETLEHAKQNLRRGPARDRAPASEDMYPPPPGFESQTFGAAAGSETTRTGRTHTARSGRRPSLSSRQDSVGGGGAPMLSGRSGMSSSRLGKGRSPGKGSEAGGGLGSEHGAGATGGAPKPLTKAQKEAAAETEANRLVLVDYLNGKYAGREMPPPPAPPAPPEDDHRQQQQQQQQHDAHDDLGLNDGTLMAVNHQELAGQWPSSADEAALAPSLVPKLKLNTGALAAAPALAASSSSDNADNKQWHGTAGESAGGGGGAPSRAGSKAGSARQPPGGRRASEGSKKPKPKRGDPKEWVVAWHVCDFGNVVSGVTRKRVFRVTNTSSVGKLSFGFDAHVLDGTGFSVDPPNVLHLPENEAEAFTVTFFASKAVTLGQKEVLLALDLKNGPSTVIVLKANVTVPEVHLSADHLHFGPCWVGCSRILYVQVHNRSPVKAEWDFKKAMGSSKDEGKFTLEPRAGVLHPDERQVVAVEYVPTEERPHAVRLPLKVAQSTKTRSLVLEGSGVATKLLFDPPLLELGPILPYAEAGAVGAVTLTNASDRPVEVYSLDFDAQYEAEEAQLRFMPGYGSDDVLRLPVRMPGQPLAGYVQEEYAKGLAQQEAAAAEAGSTVGAGTALGGGDAPGGGGEVAFFSGSVGTGGSSLAASGAAAAATGKDADGLVPLTPRWDKDESARMVGLANDTVVVGPPTSGVSALAAGLAETYGYRLTTVDEVVKDMLGTASELGRDLRIKLGQPTPGDGAFMHAKVAKLKAQVEAEAAAKQAAFDAMDAKEKKKAKAELPKETEAEKELKLLEAALAAASSALVTAAPGAAAAAESLAESSGGGAAPEAAAAATPPQADAADGASPDAPSESAGVELSVAELAAAIALRLDRTDCGRGVVVDSLSCSYLRDPSLVAQAVAQALPNATLCVLGFRNRSCYARRLDALYGDAQEKLDALQADPTVPRDVFANKAEWALLEQAASEAAAAAKRETEEAARRAELGSRRKSLAGGALVASSRTSTPLRPESRPGTASRASAAGSRPGSSMGSSGGRAGGGGVDEFSGPFKELDDFELGMLDDDALGRYHAARRRHMRALVEAARLEQQKVCTVWNPLVGLLPRSGDFHEAKEKQALAVAAAAGAAGGGEGSDASVDASVDSDDEAPDPEDPEEGGVANTPYWVYADGVKAVRAAFQATSPSPQNQPEGQQQQQQQQQQAEGAPSSASSVGNASDNGLIPKEAGGGGGGGGGAGAPPPPPRVIAVECGPEAALSETLESLLALVPKSTLKLPTPDDVPPAKTKQLIRRPPPRLPRDLSVHFQILGPRLVHSSSSSAELPPGSELPLGAVTMAAEGGNEPSSRSSANPGGGGSDRGEGEGGDAAGADNASEAASPVADVEAPAAASVDGGGSAVGEDGAAPRGDASVGSGGSARPDDREDRSVNGGGAGGNDEEEGGGSGNALVELGETATRWVLPPHSSAEFSVKFTSQTTGKFNGALGFEVLGLPGREFQLLCSGTCELPTVSDDPRNVFMNRVKSRSEAAPPVPKRFVMSRGVYEFGPLLTWKPLAGLAPPPGLPPGLNLNSPKLSKELDFYLTDGGSSGGAGDADPAPNGGGNEELRRAVQLHVDTKKTNAETFRVSNNGRFPAKVKFDFEVSSNPIALEDAEKRDPARDVFFVEPQEATLSVDETCDVTVWALPERAERYNDMLVVCVDQNPLPTLFPVTCIGVVPKVSLHGPWERNALGVALDDASASASAASASTAGGGDKAAGKGDKSRPASKEGSKKESATSGAGGGDDDGNLGGLIDFDRLLLGKAEDAEFTVTNDSFVSVQWRLDLSGCSTLDEFEVRPTQGVLGVGQSAIVKVLFTTIQEAVFEFPITVRYTDAEAASHNWDDPAAADTPEALAKRVFSTALKVKAEAYQINAVAFEDSEGQALPGGKGGTLDFGLLRVGDSKAETFNVKNKGKYPIDFGFSVRKPAVKELFTVEPSEGQIAPGATQDVTVTFCSTHEVVLQDNKDIRCTISEPHTGVAFETFNVVTSVRSCWSRFKLQPGRGLAFGAVKFNEEARARQFQIKNEGQFAFVFAVKDGGPDAAEDEAVDDAIRSATPRALLGEQDADKKGGGSAGEGTVAAPTGPKDVGRFSLSPCGGTVEPGETVAVELKFAPEGGPAVHKAVLSLLVSGSDPLESAVANAKQFEVVGETCHPGINTTDFREVFEEQSVIPSLAEVLEQRAKLAEQQQGGGGGGGGGAAFAEASLQPCYCEQEALFTYGAVVSSSRPNGVLERFKVSNVSKIPCRVNFELCPSVADAQGKSGGDGKGGARTSDVGAFAIAEGCTSADIAPHEHFYVPVHFTPTEMRSYRCAFKAVVADGEAVPSASTLSFDLAGRGTLPCVTVEKPLVRSDAGEVVVEFGRVHAGKHATKALTLTNDGIVPATALFERPVTLVESGEGGGVSSSSGASVGSEGSARSGRGAGVSAFSCTASGTSITLQPGERQTFHASFAPPEEGAGSGGGGGGSPTSQGQQQQQQQGFMGPNAASVRMTVMHNPFETTTFRMVGECYANDVMLEDLPTSSSGAGGGSGDDGEEGGSDQQQQAAENTLNFGEYDLEHESGPKVVTFTMRNRTDEAIRFEWPAAAAGGGAGGGSSPFSVEPRLGHLGPGAARQVRASFHATGESPGSGGSEGGGGAPPAVNAESVPLTLKTTRIRYLDEDSGEPLKAGERPTMMDWVVGLRATRPATLAEIEAFNGPSAGAAAPSPALRVFLENGRHVVDDEVAEPKHDATAAPTTQDLLCSAVADVARFECDTQQVPFAPTSMFQARSFTFEVRNPGSMSLPYRWGVEDAVKPGSALALTRSVLTPAAHHHHNQLAPVPCPFTVEPAEGTIAGKASQAFKVKFAPQEVENFMYFLTARMPTLPDGAEPLKVMLRGQSTRPVAHVDLVDSPDYLGRRAPGTKNERGVVGPIEASTTVRVAELTSRGTRVRNTKRFCVHNPTGAAYEFTWEAVGEPDPAWRCATPRGNVAAGRKGEMIFEYTPDALGVAEAFFKLKIPAHGLEELFLFAGSVIEPEVFFDRTRLDFNALMLGTVATERVHLENKEHLPFSFSFDRHSLGGADGVKGGAGARPVLEVSPMSGMVPPNGRAAVDVTFCPGEESFQNFNLVANVRRKPIPLGLNVKGEGYALHAHMTVAGGDGAAAAATAGDGEGAGGGAGGAVQQLLPAPTVNYVDFGSMFLNESRAKKLVLANQGRFNFDYLWQRSRKAAELGPMLEVRGAQLGGTVRKGEAAELTWTFRPVNAEVDLDGAEFSCTVAGRQDYVVKLRGQGVKPALLFSFTKHDFGPCFTTPPGALPVEEVAVLRVTNQDPSQSLSLDCTFEATRALSVACPPRVLEPGAYVEVPFKFTPRELVDYAYTVPFVVNGSSNVAVRVSGAGVAARLELANPSDLACAFGALGEGEEAVRALKVVNRSRKQLAFQVVDQKQEVGGQGRLEAQSVVVRPLKPTLLQPRESAVVEVRYAPPTRAAPFAEDLLVRFAGHEKKLTTVSGSSTGMAVALEQDTLPFGTVCSGSLLTRPLTLENSGDLPAQFRWQQASFGTHFSIDPLEGRVLPGADTTFQVTFKPQHEGPDLRAEGMRLFVDGSAPLLLTCLGACVAQPEDSISELKFEGRARRATAQTVTLSNPTPKPWFLTPVLTGDHWRCAQQVQVPANGSAPFEVTYFPLCMTSSSGGGGGDDGSSTASGAGAALASALEGSLFFALPTGSALMYKLTGTGTAPDAEGTAEVTTPAKRVATVPLLLRNWLPRPQRLDVRIDLREDTDAAATNFEGTQTVNLPAGRGASFEYALKVKAFKEGAPCGCRVTFTNPRTGEFLFHDVNVSVTTPETTETIALESALRQVARHLITVDNPLPPSAPLTFEGGSDSSQWWSCADPCVRLLQLGEMAGNKEGTFQVEYRPLQLAPAAGAGAGGGGGRGGVGGTVETVLEFRIAELGTYRYNLALTALPPTSEPSLRFDSPLGGSQTETFTFRNFNKQAQSYTCSVGNPAFFEVVGSPTLSAPPCVDWEGQELKVAVRFEPEALGSVEDVLVVQPAGSPPGSGDEHRVRLHGACRRPQPQGPFEVPLNGAKDVPVRNVFAQDREYLFTVDSPAFTVGAPRTTIKAKESANCSVRYAPTGGGGGGGGMAGDTAKLFVSCPAAPDMPPWVFYLKGGQAKEKKEAAPPPVVPAAAPPPTE